MTGSEANTEPNTDPRQFDGATVKLRYERFKNI